MRYSEYGHNATRLEQVWHHRKTDLNLSSISLEGRQGAYATLGIKIVSYLLLQQVSRSMRLPFHQTQLQLSGKRQMLSTLSEHFHARIQRKH